MAATGRAMHGMLDREIYFHLKRYVETKEMKHFVVQERDVSYRFYTHYHDYVTVLEDRLRRRGLAGLQAADTEYLPDRESLPESVEFALGADAGITILERSGMTLRATTQARLPDGTQLELAPSVHLHTAGAAAATAPHGLHATLVKGMKNTPFPANPSRWTRSRRSSSWIRPSSSRPTPS
ncbi:hypothetical protein OUO20_05505 [Arthrobacter sp. FX8]|uniref:hypothetical protein n=1 Tax=Arthrobacter sp. FX8 TaxID=2997335 RepID=UPI00227B05A5|nr:hypothetical protein [Arthrobacter sp. FX8]WAJ34391.1 hypothetical protein OUO20_05505 [Arthrobacter sp. FX8]